MKTLMIAGALLLTAPLSLTAGEHIYCKSPDGKFAVQLNGDQPYADSKLVWSKDSRRVASFRDEVQGGVTRIFFLNGSTFDEIKLPELPAPPLPELPKADATNSETVRRMEPIRWLESGDLLLENELQNKAGARTAYEVTLGFDQDNRASIRKSEQEKMSILDYFLLLPADTFEGPPYAWLYVMRANGEIIDKENGYLSGGADGAQPSFDVALFRYRDGRPLLALCSGELEGADSVQLQFFELGAGGKMHRISHPVLPVADLKNDPGMGYVKEGWQFELPRTGKTIRVRMQKGGKILHKFTWIGEKFVEEK